MILVCHMNIVDFKKLDLINMSHVHAHRVVV